MTRKHTNTATRHEDTATRHEDPATRHEDASTKNSFHTDSETGFDFSLTTKRLCSLNVVVIVRHENLQNIYTPHTQAEHMLGQVSVAL